MGSILVAVAILGISFIRDDSSELRLVMEQQIHPLGQISALHVHANEIRRLETELPRIRDFFAAHAAIEDLNISTDNFQDNLKGSIHQLNFYSQADQEALWRHWELYRTDLEETLNLVNYGEFSKGEEHSTYNSAPRFMTFIRELDILSSTINTQAANLYSASQNRQKKRQYIFITLSLVGVCLGFSFAVFFSRIISQRLHRLTCSANQLAQGKPGQVFADDATDELGDLADSLNEMYIKIQEREYELRDLSLSLEDIVHARTQQLKSSNSKFKKSETGLKKAQKLAKLGSWEYHPDSGMLKLSDQLKANLSCSESEIPADPSYILKRFFFEEDHLHILHLFKEKQKLRHISGIEQRIRNSKGDPCEFWLEAEWSYDEHGVIQEAIGIAQDITERKNLEEQLLKSQRLDAVGQLAGGIAHDFNNLLGVIIGNTYMAQKNKEKPNKLQRNLNEVQKASERAKVLAYKLLTFAKGGEDKREIFSIAELLEETTELMMAGFRLTPEIDIATDLMLVKADRAQIGQVIQNLLLNARDAMTDKGDQLTIKARNISRDDAGISKSKDKQFLEISVIDSGIGVSENDRSKIFDLYFSTKNRGTEKGTGLGLAICHSVLHKHRGDIRVSPTPGGGTTFTCYLPAIRGQVSAEISSEQIQHGKGKILVMDDEEMIRKIAEELLYYLGYQVETASCGEEALTKFKKQKDDGNGFDAVILDLTIRDGMGGHETLSNLLQIDPEVKAIACSGYSDTYFKVPADHRGWSAIVNKPYNIEELSQALIKLTSLEKSAI